MFNGSLESQKVAEDLQKQLRIQRLKQVRSQEQNIAAANSQRFRATIVGRKEAREQESRNKKIKIQEDKVRDLTLRWGAVLVENGDGHRGAKNALVKADLRVQMAKKTNAERKHLFDQFEQEALRKIQVARQAERDEERKRSEANQLRRDVLLEERENSHAIAEAKMAREQLRIRNAQQQARNNPPVQWVKGQPVARQSAVSIQERGPKIVQARVIKHGPSDRDRSTVRSESGPEDHNTQRRLWARVMSELVGVKKRKMRAVEAKVVIAKTQQVEYLESELALLHAADMSGARLRRIRSADHVPSEYAQGTWVLEEFEKQFLVQTIDPAQSSALPTPAWAHRAAESTRAQSGSERSKTLVTTALATVSPDRPGGQHHNSHRTAQSTGRMHEVFDSKPILNARPPSSYDTFRTESWSNSFSTGPARAPPLPILSLRPTPQPAVTSTETQSKIPDAIFSTDPIMKHRVNPVGAGADAAGGLVDNDKPSVNKGVHRFVLPATTSPDSPERSYQDEDSLCIDRRLYDHYIPGSSSAAASSEERVEGAGAAASPSPPPPPPPPLLRPQHSSYESFMNKEGGQDVSVPVSKPVSKPPPDLVSKPSSRAVSQGFSQGFTSSDFDYDRSHVHPGSNLQTAHNQSANAAARSDSGKNQSMLAVNPERRRSDLFSESDFEYERPRQGAEVTSSVTSEFKESDFEYERPRQGAGVTSSVASEFKESDFEYESGVNESTLHSIPDVFGHLNTSTSQFEASDFEYKGDSDAGIDVAAGGNQPATMGLSATKNQEMHRLTQFKDSEFDIRDRIDSTAATATLTSRTTRASAADKQPTSNRSSHKINEFSDSDFEYDSEDNVARVQSTHIRPTAVTVRQRSDSTSSVDSLESVNASIERLQQQIEATLASSKAVQNAQLRQATLSATSSSSSSNDTYSRLGERSGSSVSDAVLSRPSQSTGLWGSAVSTSRSSQSYSVASSSPTSSLGGEKPQEPVPPRSGNAPLSSSVGSFAESDKSLSLSLSESESRVEGFPLPRVEDDEMLSEQSIDSLHSSREISFTETSTLDRNRGDSDDYDSSHAKSMPVSNDNKRDVTRAVHISFEFSNSSDSEGSEEDEDSDDDDSVADSATNELNLDEDDWNSILSESAVV